MYRTPRSLAVLAALALAGCAQDAPFALGAGLEHGTTHVQGAKLSAEENRQLAELRRITAPFHNFEHAAEGGYGTPITPCWEHRTQGAMGYHYGNPELIDGTVNLLEPEVLMYEPGAGGQMRLVGMEYIVPIDDWSGASPPRLLGQDFHPHSFLPIYKLHIWLWRENERGLYADWNPKVSCEHAEETEYFE
jgi:hypothetical protein